jgi:hypothetical protein
MIAFSERSFMPRFLFFLVSFLTGSWANLGLGMDPNGLNSGLGMDPNGTDSGIEMDPNG